MSIETAIDAISRFLGTSIEVNPERSPVPAERFLVISARGHPKWLLPETPGAGIAVLRQWQPYSFGARVKWAILKQIYQLNLLGVIPGVARISLHETSNHKLHTTPLIPVTYIGMPGPQQKAVCFLLGHSDLLPLRIAKLPIGPKAIAATLKEAEILKLIQFSSSVTAPQMISVDRETGITVQEGVLGTPSSFEFTDAHLEYLFHLRSKQFRAFFSMIGRLQTEASRLLQEPTEREILKGIFDTLSCHRDIDLPLCVCHGDFAPWNLILSTTLVAVDWENAFEEGPPGFDLIYFFTQTAFLFGRKQWMTAAFHRYWLAYLQSLNIDIRLSRSLILINLLRDWLRARELQDLDRARYLMYELQSATNRSEA